MLDRNEVTVKQERPARKEPLTDPEVTAMLRGVNKVIIARGKKTEAHAAKDVTPAMLKGPSGNVRAPLVVRGKSMLVGLSLETLEDWFSS